MRKLLLLTFGTATLGALSCGAFCWFVDLRDGAPYVRTPADAMSDAAGGAALGGMLAAACLLVVLAIRHAWRRLDPGE